MKLNQRDVTGLFSCVLSTTNDDVCTVITLFVSVSVLTFHNLQVQQTGALADCITGRTLIESCGAGADVFQGNCSLYLV